MNWTDTMTAPCCYCIARVSVNCCFTFKVSSPPSRADLVYVVSNKYLQMYCELLLCILLKGFLFRIFTK